MRTLILGKNGMLGQDMQQAFHDTDFIALGREELDITNREQVFEKFMTVQPEVVINCTGYTAVDKAEEEEELANQINGYAVGILAQACREVDATLVHFSTDYVFNGVLQTGYSEDAPTDPINAYGRSKALGEKLLVEEMELLNELNLVEGKYFLIRTSWLFGKHGKNFVDTMLQLGNNLLQRGSSASLAGSSAQPLKVVNDQHGSPTFSADLCQQVRWLLQSLEYPSGTYHITNSGATTWYDFARKIFELSGMNVPVLPCSSAEYVRPAKRPSYSLLANNRLPQLRSWEEALQAYLSL